MRWFILWSLLVVVWVLLWDSVTVGQVLAGALVATVLLVLLPRPPAGTEAPLPVRPVATVRLFLWFGWQFVLSNVQVVRAVLLPGRHVRTGVVTVQLRRASPTLAALVSNMTALTPGMQPVDGVQEPLGIRVHVLSLRSEQEVQAIVHHLEDLVYAAFGPSLRDGVHPGDDLADGPGEQR